MALEAGETECAINIWLCDSDGGLHVLCHAISSDPSIKSKWREVDGSMARVVCGPQGAVCGISKTDHELYVRAGVGFNNPLGKNWSRTGHKSVDVAVGRKLLVSRIEKGDVFSAPLGVAGSADFSPLRWDGLSNDPPENLDHLVLDSSDTLYGVTGLGEVFVCPGLENRGCVAGWERLAKPPSAKLKISLLSSLFRGSGTAFCSVTAGANCLWCLREKELWQLVLSRGVGGLGLRRRTNWVKFTIPKERSVSRISAGGSHLFAITDDGCSLLRLKLCSPLVQWEELPFHGCGDITLSSLSVCCLPVEQQNASSLSSPSLYPKLPKLSKEHDVCCENGTCTFCTRQQQQQQPLARGELHHYLHKGQERRLPRKGQLAGQKRHLDDDDTFYTCYTYLPLKKQRRGSFQ